MSYTAKSQLRLLHGITVSHRSRGYGVAQTVPKLTKNSDMMQKNVASGPEMGLANCVGGGDQPVIANPVVVAVSLETSGLRLFVTR